MLSVFQAMWLVNAVFPAMRLVSAICWMLGLKNDSMNGTCLLTLLSGRVMWIAGMTFC